MTFFITPFHYTDCFSVRQIGYGGNGCTVCAVEPGGGPVPVGKDDRGVCEFVINLKMTYMKE